MQYKIREGAAVLIEHVKERRVTSFIWRSQKEHPSLILNRKNLEDVGGGIHFFRVNSALLLVSSADLYTSL